MSFFNLYGNPNKRGIDKNAPEKRAFFEFTDIYGLRFFKIMGVSLLYFFTSVPFYILTTLVMTFIFQIFATAAPETMMFILGVDTLTDSVYLTASGVFSGIIAVFVCVFLGAGPTTAGFHYVLRNYVRHDHAWIFSDFFGKTFKNFGQAFLVWLFSMIGLVLLAFAWIFYSSMGGIFVYFEYVVYFFLLIFVMMHIYIYQLMVTFKLGIKDLYKNALLMAFGGFSQNFLTLLIVLIAVGGAFLLFMNLGRLLLFYFIFALVLLGFAGLMYSFVAHLSIKKILPKEKEYPEEF